MTAIYILVLAVLVIIALFYVHQPIHDICNPAAVAPASPTLAERMQREADSIEVVSLRIGNTDFEYDPQATASRLRLMAANRLIAEGVVSREQAAPRPSIDHELALAALCRGAVVEVDARGARWIDPCPQAGPARTPWAYPRPSLDGVF